MSKINLYSLHSKAMKACEDYYDNKYNDEGGIYADILSSNAKEKLKQYEAELKKLCFPEKYYEIKGDLLDTFAPVIVHGCNCQGKMGSGVAKLLRDKYPQQVYDKYYQVYKTQGLKLGQIVPVYTHDGKIILNAMTQEFYGNDGRLYADYQAIRTCLTKVNNYCKQRNISFVAMPKIGCGLAGGDWNIVKVIIQETMKDVITLVYYLE